MIPWFLKMPAKMILARSPIPRGALNQIGIFRHGSMVRADYATEIVNRHVAFAKTTLTGKTVLELGPGDSVGNGIIAFALGAERSFLVDSGDWASKSLEMYRRFVRWLDSNLADPRRLREVGQGWATYEELLESFRITYATNGLKALVDLPSASIDFCFSEAVLEHIRIAEFSRTIAELRRISKATAVGSHVIDFKDHMQAGLNNMRFSSRVWESGLFSQSGFYTNRLRHCDVIQTFIASRFDVVEDDRTLWEHLPTPIGAIHPELRRYPDAELLIREASILVRPARE